MTIDWITVSAQIVNFLILVWLLRHFLYRPVIRAMDRREQRIAERLSQAETREWQADAKARQYQEKQEALERGREDALQQARQEAAQEKRRLLDAARQEVSATRQQWRRQVEQEKAEFLTSLRKQAAETVQLIARKALVELAGAGLEQQTVQVFIERLKALDQEARDTLGKAASTVHIASAFELDSGLRGRLTRAVHEHLVEGVTVEYAQSPELVCGLELRAGGQRLGWNLGDYLDALDERIERSLAAQRPAAE